MVQTTLVFLGGRVMVMAPPSRNTHPGFKHGVLLILDLSPIHPAPYFAASHQSPGLKPAAVLPQSKIKTRETRFRGYDRAWKVLFGES
jgi:hypothetical protein